jgi:hypothetical protein
MKAWCEVPRNICSRSSADVKAEDASVIVGAEGADRILAQRAKRVFPAADGVAACRRITGKVGP